jgi:hypothetical protein
MQELYNEFRSTRWRSWLRHRSTSWTVAGSIPNGVTGIFHWNNPSCRTMALGLTQPLTEMSTRNMSCGWRRPVCRSDNLTTFTCRLSWNLGASTSWNPQGLSRPVMGLLYLLYTWSSLSDRINSARSYNILCKNCLLVAAYTVPCCWC